jgi:cytochrome c553
VKRAAAALAAWSLIAPGEADDLARAEELVQGRCFVCHGFDGESSTPLFPRLSGQNAAYLARQLADYKAGRRKSSQMEPMVADLCDGDFRALGAYFAARAPRSHPVENAELAERGRTIFDRGNAQTGVAPCAQCHGHIGQGTDTLPRLAGQHAQYVERQLKAFTARERTNDNAVMHEVARKLGDVEVKAVAAYLSGLK